MILHVDITVRGIVQGVGFRPFVYRLAAEHRVRGVVYNTTEGVRVEAEGESGNLKSFVDGIRHHPPPLALVQSVEESRGDVAGYEKFSIVKSEVSGSRTAFVSPDIALCDDCLRELLDPGDFRHRYPFITCTNCGPRFSIVDDIPYDRKNTSMAAFPMCRVCEGEYRDPENRRFHAQPNACPACGPRLSLLDREGNALSFDAGQIAARAVKLLKEGMILAIKGVGGYLIACDAENDGAVARLRERKGRPFKPFALMAGSVESIGRHVRITPAEKILLDSRERPIVLLKEKPGTLSTLVSPGLTYLGFMLPYAPFQHMLFEADPGMVLVMTSGNIADEPIIFRDAEALERLAHAADFFVTYNREIVAQSDDSVLFVEGEAPYMVRRSRGYVPAPFISRRVPAHMLAAGGDLKNSFALAKDDIVVLGQFLGDLAMASGDEQYRRTLAHYMRIYDFTPAAVVSDLHPGYFTTLIADELEAKGLRRARVQHHHAHIAAVMEEHGLDGEVIGIAFDGTGYGNDGVLWGSEFLVARRSSFTRAAHFSEFALPGGESAIRDVWKIGASLLKAYCGDAAALGAFPGAGPVLEIIAKKINSPLTTSVGRLFDGAAALLGVSLRVSTEAEAAMLLEEAAFRGKGRVAPEAAGIDAATGVIDTGHFVRRVMELKAHGEEADDIALAFHGDIALTALRAATAIRERAGINRVALSGGAFQNRLLLRMILAGLAENEFDIYVPRKVPFNDGCIALGQIAVAREIIA